MVLHKGKVRQIVNGRYWFKKGSFEKLDSIVADMISDMADKLYAMKAKNVTRKRANAEDIEKAYNLHKETYVVDKISEELDKTTNMIKSTFEAVKAGAEAAYGRSRTD